MPDGTEPPAGLDPLLLRGALGLFATGVTILTARHPDGRLVGLTANSFSSVSLDPPLVLVSLSTTARSLAPLLEAPGFAVNVLAEGQRALADRFASRRNDKWDGVEWKPGRNGAPLLPGTMAAFDCLHHAQYEGGDHRIVLGRVVAVEHDRTGGPLLFFASRYHGLGDPMA